QIKAQFIRSGLDSEPDDVGDDVAHVAKLFLPHWVGNNEHLVELPDVAPAVIQAGALRFDRIPVQRPQSSAVANPQDGSFWRVYHFIRCTDTVDVFWGPEFVDFVKAPHVLTPIFSSEKRDSLFGDVQWD